MSGQGQWPEVARQWALLGPPLRPSPEDSAFAAQALARWQQAHQRAPQALILGVTPELYALPWPAGSEVRALDCTPAMIAAVWPGPPADALCGDWTAMPLAAESQDLVLCDGGLTLLERPGAQAAFVREVQRVLRPGGFCLLRLFVPPAVPESLENVLAAMWGGQIASVNHLKLRLLMALQTSAAAGVRLGDAWQCVVDAAPHLAQLAQQAGWPLAELEVMQSYRGRDTRYHFLTLAEVQPLFCAGPGGFAVEAVQVPAYQLGECCPTLLLRRL